jgi:hypothetical protein
MQYVGRQHFYIGQPNQLLALEAPVSLSYSAAAGSGSAAISTRALLQPDCSAGGIGRDVWHGCVSTHVFHADERADRRSGMGTDLQRRLQHA